MPEKFHQRFGIDLGVDEVKRRFVNRALNFLLDEVPKRAAYRYGIDGKMSLEQHICSTLGERWKGDGCLSTVLGDHFETCLRALEALFNHPNFIDDANEGAIAILKDMEIDIGIRWGKGHFLPAGAPALDSALVTDPLNLLNLPEHKGISVAFQKGLDHFLHSTKKPALLADVLTDMHEALEALAKIVCGNDRDLSANREALVSKLKLSDPYKRMLREYIEYANDVGRHAGTDGREKPLPSQKEVEAFMYLTGLFIRLALSKEV